MFNKNPDNLWTAVFNVFQGGTMTVAVCLYLGQTTPVILLKTFVCAYCAGVMLTQFLNAKGFGDWVARHLGCGDRPLAGYLVSGATSGAMVGVFMNFFMTFMAIGPVPEFPGAFFHTLLYSMVVSAIASCCWVKLAQVIVGKVYGKPE